MFSSLKIRVLLLVGIPFAVMLGMAVYYTLGEREERLADARNQIIGTTRLIAAEQRRIIERAHQILLSVALLPELRHGIAPEACSRVLAQKVREGGVFVNMLVARTNGDAICNAIGVTQPINIADRDFFQRALQTHEFEVGGYIISRSTGKPAIGIAYSLLDEAGRPELVVSATLDLGWLEKELAKFELPEGSSAVVLGHNGTVLARHPDPEGWVGKPVPADMPLARTVLGNGGEGTADELGLDGVRRIFAFTPLHKATTGQVYLWVGIPKDTVVGPVEREFVWTLLIALSLLVLTFGVFWVGSERLFLRRIMVLGGAATALGKGDLAARTSLPPGDDEIGQLAQSFDQMAGALEAKEKQLIRANRVLRVLSAGNRTMLHARSEQQLLEDLCRAIVEAGSYRIAWAGYAENDTEKTIRPIAQWGAIAEGFFENVKFTWNDTGYGRTPPGSAIRTGNPVVVQDIQKETGPEPWRQNALRCGCGSCIALPLRVGESVIGVLDVYTEEPGAFSVEEIALLSEAAADLSYGIAALRGVTELAPLKAALRTAEERLRAAFEANLDALFILKSVRDQQGNIVDFKFVDINKGAEEMLGMAREKVIGEKLCELLPINRTGGFFDKYAQVAITGQPLEEEFPIDTPEVKAKWLRHQVVRIEDGIAITSRDITAWKAAGAQLRESEETLRTIASSAQDAIVMLDNDGNIALWNAAAEKMFGYSSVEVIGKQMHSLLAPARFNAAYQAGFRHFQATGEGAVIGKTLELAALRKDGTEFPMELSLSAVKLKDKWHAVGIVRDITERKHAEQKLALVNFAMNHVHEAALLTDEHARFHYGNDDACRVLGYSREELLGLSVADIDPDFPLERWPDHWRELKARKSLTFEGRHRTKDGRVFPVEIAANYFEYEGHGYNLGLVRDITERKQAQAALQRSESSLKEAQRISHLGNWELDLATNVLSWTEEIYRIFEIDPGKFGASYEAFLDTIHPDDRESVDKAYADSVKNKTPYEIAHRLLMKDSRVKYVHEQCETYYGPDGRPLRSIGTVQDVTARKQAELALERANRALRTLSACNEVLVRAGNESELLDSICRLIVETGGYRMAWVGVPEQDPAKTVRVAAQYGYEEGYLAIAKFSWADTELGRGPTGTAIRTGNVQVIQNFLTNPQLAPWREAARRRSYQSNIALPLKNASGTFGALTIYAQEPDAFNEDEVKLLQELAEDLFFGIETLRTRAERDRIAYAHQHHAEILRQSLQDSIKVIADTVEMRDPYTAGHQRRVGELAVAISRELGLPEDTIRGIELAAGIHDLGKIKVPAEILSKPGKLTDVEFMLIKMHPQSGYDILKDIKFPWPIAAMVWQHHERLDGSGYPQGLKDGEILLESRIMAVADVVEAMASHRPYRAALGIDVALKEIERGRGTAYDPAVVDGCLKLFREKGFAFQET
jgi:PAS domain S-box-containing protein